MMKLLHVTFSLGTQWKFYSGLTVIVISAYIGAILSGDSQATYKNLKEDWELSL